jgi:hypothetical protein
MVAPYAVDAFFTALARLDAETIGRLYDEDASYEDPVFGRLAGSAARRRWQLFCWRAARPRLRWAAEPRRDGVVEAHWHMACLYGQRRLDLAVRSEFVVQGSRILIHADTYDFWTWARQTLGPTVWLRGVAPNFRRAVRRRARSELGRFDAPRRA